MVCLYPLCVHVCGEGIRGIQCRQSISERINRSGRMQCAFAFVTGENSLCFGATGGVRSVESVMLR